MIALYYNIVIQCYFTSEKNFSWCSCISNDSFNIYASIRGECSKRFVNKCYTRKKDYL